MVFQELFKALAATLILAVHIAVAVIVVVVSNLSILGMLKGCFPLRCSPWAIFVDDYAPDADAIGQRCRGKFGWAYMGTSRRHFRVVGEHGPNTMKMPCC